jgi:4-carboxymuconolactone decarboxylase
MSEETSGWSGGKRAFGGNIDQVNFHLPFATQNGVTEEELIEAITQLAFCTGWPKAMSAMTVAKNQFQSHAAGDE